MRTFRWSSDGRRHNERMQVGGKIAMDLTMPAVLGWVLGGNVGAFKSADRKAYCRISDKPKAFQESVRRHRSPALPFLAAVLLSVAAQCRGHHDRPGRFASPRHLGAHEVVQQMISPWYLRRCSRPSCMTRRRCCGRPVPNGLWCPSATRCAGRSPPRSPPCTSARSASPSDVMPTIRSSATVRWCPPPFRSLCGWFPCVNLLCMHLAPAQDVQLFSCVRWVAC